MTGASKSQNLKKGEHSFKFDGTAFQKKKWSQIHCSFSLSVLLLPGPKDKCSYGSAQENTATTVQHSGHKTRERFPAGSYQGDNKRETWEYDCIRLFMNSWAHICKGRIQQTTF